MRCRSLFHQFLTKINMNLYPLIWDLQDHNPIGIALDWYYERRYAIEKISGFADNLSSFMMTMEHCTVEHLEKLKHEADLYWNEIDKCSYVQYSCGRRKSMEYRIKRSVLLDHLWEMPFGEYRSYLSCYKNSTNLRCCNEDNHYKGTIICGNEEGIELTPPSEAAWLELKRKYMKAIDMIEAGDMPEYDEL